MNDIQQVTQQFFNQIKAGQFERAYQSTTQEFKASGSLQDFQNFLENTGLAHFTELLLSGLEQSEDIFTLNGTIILGDKRNVQIIIYLKQENQQWKIHNVTPAIENRTGITLPDQYTLISTIHKYITLFILSVQQSNFAPLYIELAEVWKKETSPENLQGIFQNFIDTKIDLSFVFNANPAISEEPELNENGIITVKGYYPATTQNLLYELSLTYEHPEWKLVSMKITQKIN